MDKLKSEEGEGKREVVLLVLGIGLWLNFTVNWRWSSQQPVAASSIPHDQYAAQAASHNYVKIRQRLP